MKRYIIIFKEKTNYDLILSMGGILVDDLDKIPKLAIADLPIDKIEELRLNSEIEKIEEDNLLDIDSKSDLQADEEPYLHLLDGYIQVPRITYDSIVLEIAPEPNPPASGYYFDLRLNNEGTETASYATNGNETLTTGITASVNGVNKATNTDFIPNSVKTEVKFTLKTTNTNTPILFASRGLTYRARVKLYSVKFYLGNTLVLHYDASTGTLNDQSGNGNHGVLTNGEWVGVEVVEESFPSFVKVDGGLNFTLTALRARDYWDRGLTGKGIKVGVIDIAFGHNCYVRYEDATSVVSDPYYTAPYGQQHGLECVSQIVSDSVYTEQGIHLGLSNDALVYGVKGGNWGGVSLSGYLSSINYLIQNEVYIMSSSMLSVGVDGEFDSVITAIDTLVNTYDGAFFMSVGNQNVLIEDRVGVLNSFAPIILVGGISKSYKRFYTSNSGSNQSANLEFMTTYEATVKSNTLSTSQNVIDDKVAPLNGTSFSCPQAVAIFCLYKEFYKDKTNQEIIALMSENAMKLDGRTEWDMYYGHGLLQPSPDILNLPRKINNSGLKFSSENEYIDCGSNPSLDLKDNFTLITDICVDYGNNGYLFSKYDTTIEEGLFYGLFLGHKYETGNKLIANYSHGDKLFKESSYPFSISDNKRRRLAVVYSYPNIKIYLDGVLITDKLTMSGNMLNSTSSSGSPRLYIGSPSKQTGSSFTGTLFEAKIYNRSLSDAEISNYDKLTNNLVLHYKFDGEEDIATDLSGNGNHGTIFGARPSVRRV